MSNKTYHHAVQIYYEDTDHSGVVYHPNFLKYFERAREHVIDSQRLNRLWNEPGIVSSNPNSARYFFRRLTKVNATNVIRLHQADSCLEKLPRGVSV